MVEMLLGMLQAQGEAGASRPEEGQVPPARGEDGSKCIACLLSGLLLLCWPSQTPALALRERQQWCPAAHLSAWQPCSLPSSRPATPPHTPAAANPTAQCNCHAGRPYHAAGGVRGLEELQVFKPVVLRKLCAGGHCACCARCVRCACYPCLAMLPRVAIAARACRRGMMRLCRRWPVELRCLLLPAARHPCRARLCEAEPACIRPALPLLAGAVAAAGAGCAQAAGGHHGPLQAGPGLWWVVRQLFLNRRSVCTFCSDGRTYQTSPTTCVPAPGAAPTPCSDFFLHPKSA